jgi:hypothetical protein
MAGVQEITIHTVLCALEKIFFRVAEEETFLTNRKCIPIMDALYF